MSETLTVNSAQDAALTIRRGIRQQIDHIGAAIMEDTLPQRYLDYYGAVCDEMQRIHDSIEVPE